MEIQNIGWMVWGSLVVLGTLVGWARSWGKERDLGLNISVAVSLLYGGLTALEAWWEWPPLPQWWAVSFGIIGLLIVFLSQMLSIWAGRTIGKYFSANLRPLKNAQLVTTGPFGICRHPIMLSYLMMWVGTAMALGSVVMLVVLTPISMLIFYRIAREEVLLAQTYGDAFETYRQNVPLITPFTDAQSKDAKEVETFVAHLAGGKPKQSNHMGS